MIEPAIILPVDYADPIAQSSVDYGTLDLKWSEAEKLVLVDGFRMKRDGYRLTGSSDLARQHHALAYVSPATSGLWYRVEPGLHAAGIVSRVQSGAIPLDRFREATNGGWIEPARDSYTFALTCTTTTELEGVEINRWAGWLLSGATQQAQWCAVEVIDETEPLLAPLAPAWPLLELSDVRVALIGVGSIGSAAAEGLAAYGVKHLILIDPDRLQAHNFARHRTFREQVGRLKVNAMADRLRERDPALQVDVLALDVIHDADQLRPLLREIDLAVVCVDGVNPRRAANHLIRRAGKPGIFACVLEDGAFGEILRLDPRRGGCLLCARAALKENGGLSPETTLDRGYGMGTEHLPMTAVTGDLGLMGDLAAKVSISTMLERKGFRDQRLPGDHAVIGLRPKPGRREPFDIDTAGQVRWHTLPASRPGCPSCS